MLPRFNIGARFNTFSTTINRLGRSFINALVESESSSEYASSGSCNVTTTVTSESSVVCSSSGRVECSADAHSESFNLLVLVPDTTQCSATVTNIEPVFVVSTVQCTASVVSESTSVHYATGKSITNVICASRALSDDIVIAAYDSPLEDQLFADYICTGQQDQATIMTAVNTRKNRFNNTTIKGKLTLRFARGMYNCDNSFKLKDVDIIGSGANSTVFEFKRLIESPKSMLQSTMEMMIRTTGTTTLDSFMVSGGGVLRLIYDDPTVFTGSMNVYNLNNVYATNFGYKSGQMHSTNSLGKIIVEVAFPVPVVEPRTIPDVYLNVENCKVWNTDYSGFLLYGNKDNYRFARSLKDIYFNNTHAEMCGDRDIGDVVAGFNLLLNISTENIRMQNCTSHSNWHCGFYFDDAKPRNYKNFYGSNVVYNLFMENCKAYRNGHRSTNYTSPRLLPMCCGFILREMASDPSDISDIPQFVVHDINGYPVFDANGNLTYNAPAYPSTLRDARGPYVAHDLTQVAYGNIVNCFASNNQYAAYYLKGFKQNVAELNILNCYASGGNYSMVVDNQDGLYVEGLVSDRVGFPTIMLKNVNIIDVKYMRVVEETGSQFITFKNLDGYDDLMLDASKYIEVIS